MKKAFLTLILFFAPMVEAIDNYMVQIHTAMIPKLMLLDQSLPSANPHTKITLAVIYDEMNGVEAKAIAQQIGKQQNYRLGQATLSVVALDINAPLRLDDVHFIYLLETTSKKARMVAQIANDKHIPIFAYDPDDLSNGALLSVSVERRSMIYLSASALRNSQHRFADALYQIAKLID